MKIVKAFLAVNCPMGGVVEFELCKKCTHNGYTALTEYAVECTAPETRGKRG